MEATDLELNPRNTGHLVWKHEEARSKRSRSEQGVGKGKKRTSNMAREARSRK